MMEVDNAIKSLKEAYEGLKDKKRRLRDLNGQVKAEIEATPRFKQVDEELINARARMKAIKVEALERTGLAPDIDALKNDIAVEQDAIAGIVEFLIKQNGLKNGVEMELGAFKVTPKLSVKFTNQMMLGL